MLHTIFKVYSKTCLKRPLSKKTKLVFQDQLSLNAGQKYCRKLKGEHSAILLIFIKLPFVFKTFVLSFFEWPLKTGFTVVVALMDLEKKIFLKFLLVVSLWFKRRIFKFFSL